MTDFVNHRHPTMVELKQETIKDENIIVWQGYHRYINRDKKLLTTGFKSKEKLLDWSNNIRFDTGTLEIMTERYLEYSKGETRGT